MGKDSALGPGGLDSVQSLPLRSHVAKFSNSFNILICKMGMMIYNNLIGLRRRARGVSCSPGHLGISLKTPILIQWLCISSKLPVAAEAAGLWTPL